MKRFYLYLILCISVTVFFACEEEPGSPIQDSIAPSIPPVEMYTVPTTVLNDIEADTVEGQTLGHSYHNWTHAAINLVVWNTVVALNVGIPIASFGLALNEDPEYLGDGKYKWSYTYDAPHSLGGKSYLIVLTGEYINNAREVEWIMQVSEEGGFEDFEWFTGITASDLSEARFTLNHKPNNPQPYMSIFYEGNVSNEDILIRYTNIDPTNNGIGGYIEYRAKSGNRYNRAFDISGGPNHPEFLVEILWSEPGLDGSVRCPQRFNDNEWYCWDSQLRDIDC